MSGPPVFSITLPGQPVPAARARITRYGNFNPARYSAWKRDAALSIAAKMRSDGVEKIGLAVAMSVDFTVSRPQRRPARAQFLHRLYWLAGRDYSYPCKPDLDNLVKAVKDACSDAGLWVDDNLVVELTATECAGDEPGVYLQISIVDPEADET